MKKDRKNIILQSLAGMLEERNMSKITTASLAEKSNITEAALYRHFPSKRSIYAELFSFCDDTVFAKCNELKKEKISSKEKVKNAFIFFMIFVEKNKGFARLLSREALSSDEQNVSENVNQCPRVIPLEGKKSYSVAYRCAPDPQSYSVPYRSGAHQKSYSAIPFRRTPQNL